jgi:hypothetical protein
MHVIPEGRSMKKCKVLHVVPEEEESIKVEPGLDVKRSLPLPAPGPSRPAHVSDLTSQCLPLSRMVVILDCHTESRIPTTEEALRLMDSERPMFGSSYFDSYDDLMDFGLDNAWKLYDMPVPLLGSFDLLGRNAARRLHEYCRDKLLEPLGLIPKPKIEDQSDDSGELVLHWQDDAHASEINTEGKGKDVVEKADMEEEEEEGSDDVASISTIIEL